MTTSSNDSAWMKRFREKQLQVAEQMEHDGHLDARACQYLRYLIPAGLAEVRYMPQLHYAQVFYHAKWLDAAEFCVAASDERGHDSAPPRRWQWPQVSED